MGKPVKAAILGLGSYVPEKQLTNADFEKMIDTSDEWIKSRTGISSRRIAADDEQTSDLALKASIAALENAGVDKNELDLIIVATFSPDYLMPSTSCILQKKLGLSAKAIPSFDLGAACSGFLYAISTAKAYIESRMAKKILVVGAETISRMLNYEDRTTCILFGDAAGAAIVGAVEEGEKAHTIRDVKLYADGAGGEHITILGGGAAIKLDQAALDDKVNKVKMNGREVFRFAVTRVQELIKNVMEEHDLKVEDIGKIVPHQANSRILQSARERLNMPEGLFIDNLAQYGNTSAASVPLALDEAQQNGVLVEGKPVILLAFGAGLTWGSAVLDW